MTKLLPTVASAQAVLNWGDAQLLPLASINDVLDMVSVKVLLPYCWSKGVISITSTAARVLSIVTICSKVVSPAEVL